MFQHIPDGDGDRQEAKLPIESPFSKQDFIVLSGPGFSKPYSVWFRNKGNNGPEHMNLIHFVMDALMYCLTKSSLNCCEQCNRFNGAAYALVFYKFMEESDCELFMKGVNDILHKEYNKKHPFTPPPVDSADEED